jgi:hypothetical protein
MLAVVSCNDSGKPDQLLDHEQMVAYLIELHLAEAAITNIRVNPDSSKYLFRIFEEDLQKKHNITDSVFVTSYNYYLQHPDELQIIYTAVVDSLSLKQTLDR